MRLSACALSALRLFAAYVTLCVLSAPGEGGLYERGAGTEEDPWVVETAEDLERLARDTDGGVPEVAAACYVQSGDIDAGGISAWMPVGLSSRPFQGRYDGRGFAIRNLRNVNSVYSHTGLFGLISNARIENVALESVSFVGVSYDGLSELTLKSTYTGGLAGEVKDSLIFNCRSSGNVKGGFARNFSRSYAGGLVGFLSGTDARIVACNSAGTVSGGSAEITKQHSTSSTFAGGIAGAAEGGVIEFSVNDAGVFGGNARKGTATGRSVTTFAGGIAGSAQAEIVNCAATGSVVAGDTNASAGIPPRSFAGGIAGMLKSGSLVSSWSRAKVEKGVENGGESFTGAFVGKMEEAEVLGRCYFLADGNPDGAGVGLEDESRVVGLSEGDLKSSSVFEGWEIHDISSAWFRRENSWPELKFHHVAPVPSVFVFSGDAEAGIPFVLAPAYDGFIVLDADCGDGFSVVSGGPSAGELRFDGSSFEGGKEILITYTLNGVPTTASVSAEAVAPEESELAWETEPEPQPDSEIVPEPGPEISPVPPPFKPDLDPDPDFEPEPEKGIPLVTEPNTGTPEEGFGGDARARGGCNAGGGTCAALLLPMMFSKNTRRKP